MNIHKLVTQSSLISLTALSFSVLALSSASALTTAATSNTSTTTTATPTTTSQQRLALIISRGNAEIARRLTSLSGLASTVASAQKLSASDKATLTSEVTSTQSGLQALQTKLDAETTVSGAGTDAAAIFTDYRVYALVTPKVYLVKTADDEQVSASDLTTLASKLQTRLDSYTGSNKASLEADLSDLTTKASAAETIASGIETGVINLQPTDYNSNHAVLSGDRNQLVTAHSDNTAAYNDAQTIVTGLKA